jgi:hypothetical protein
MNISDLKTGIAVTGIEGDVVPPSVRSFLFFNFSTSNLQTS